MSSSVIDNARPYSVDISRKRLARPASVTSRIVWRYAVPIVALHLMALSVFSPWLFSWSGVVVMILGVYFYGGIGINVGYHRLLTHRSFKCPMWLERSFVVVALCCLEDAPGSWVATHRQHHNDTDESPDPHSPLVSFLWSHVGWLMVENRDVRSFSAYERFARDVLRDPFYLSLQRSMLSVWIYLGHGLLYLLAGLLAGRLLWGDWQAAWQFGLSIVAWGVILRTVIVWHISWSVNSLTHLHGYRRYDTPENSRNNWFVALLTSGEGWHNNHHHDPASASNAHGWWELDPIFWFIWSLERVGLAHDVIRPRALRKPETSRV